jgi:hypothetical protein
MAAQPLGPPGFTSPNTSGRNRELVPAINLNSPPEITAIIKQRPITPGIVNMYIKVKELSLKEANSVAKRNQLTKTIQLLKNFKQTLQKKPTENSYATNGLKPTTNAFSAVFGKPLGGRRKTRKNCKSRKTRKQMFKN